MIIQKFGGTSLENVDAINRAIGIIERERDRTPLVVVSAAAGVTNTLLALLDQSVVGNVDAARFLIEELCQRQAGLASALLTQEDVKGFRLSLSVDRTNLIEIATGAARARVVSAETKDVVAAHGELWSSRLLARALAARGLRAGWVDSRSVLTTDDTFTNARPLFDRTETAVRRSLLPELLRHDVVVMQGFIGSTVDGRTTTIGRGGSDYSAAIVGALLDCDEIQIWTDTDGILTADPRVVPTARTLRTISFEEVTELAHYGAKVLHPSTLLPAAGKRIPVRVLNSRHTAATGTFIHYGSGSNAEPIVSITSTPGFACVQTNVRSSAEQFHANASGTGVPFDEIEFFVRSHLGFAAVIPDERAKQFSVDDRFVVQRDCSLVALVGNNAGTNVEVVASALRVLKRHSIEAVRTFTSPSNHAVVIVVPKAQMQRSVSALHDHFCDRPAIANIPERSTPERLFAKAQ